MSDNLARIVKEDASSFKILKRIVGACEEVKGKDVTILDVRSLADFADYFVVVSGRSDRQVQGLTNRITDELYKSGVKLASVEGYEDGQWVLIDCGDVIVHVFYEPVREHYDIESLWMRAHRVPMERVA
jgi:ribosome-associated protein